MSVLSLLFWGLALAAAAISARWGAMIGLIAFVFALLLGAVAVSRWAPPRHGVSGDRQAVFDRSGTETRISDINSKTSSAARQFSIVASRQADALARFQAAFPRDGQ